MNSTDIPESGFECLYVHVPFCEVKCDYCGFYSEEASSVFQRASFLRRLDEELAAAADSLQNLRTVFIGGGTPTFLGPAELSSLLGSLRRNCRLRDVTEFTVEANPESLTSDKLTSLAEAGVDRVSLGVQSFFSANRAVIGRSGSLERIQEIKQGLHDEQISNFNLDLIYAIPGQDLAFWEEDLELALAFEPPHLSTYELTPEEGSKLRISHELSLPSSDLAVEMWSRTEELCKPAGLVRYEVSNLARPGWFCLHNDLVWHGASYLGCGPAAVSFDGRQRSANPAGLGSWLERSPPETDMISPPARAIEIFAFGLRTARGWSSAEFQQRTGFDPWQLCGTQLYKLLEQGLLVRGGKDIKPTEKGLLFADQIAETLLYSPAGRESDSD